MKLFFAGNAHACQIRVREQIRMKKEKSFILFAPLIKKGYKSK
jgi:hypothetical protein